MQRVLVIGSVIATLGALLFLYLEPAEPSSRTASGEPRATPPGGARQWLPWDSQSSTQEVARLSGDEAGAPVEQDPSASEEEAADLPGTFSLRGYVTDENGQPLENVSVRARPSANSLVETRDEVETDAQGRFRLRSLAPGLYDLRFKRARFLPRTMETWRLSPHPEPLTLQLQPAPFIQGRVVDTAGNPLHDVQVHLYKLERALEQELRPSTPEGQTQIIEFPAEDVPRSYARSMRTEPDGTFILDTEEPGTWLLRTRSEGFTPVEQEVTSPAKDVQLVLGSGTSVEVTVVDRQDRPVPRANVALWRHEDEENLTTEVTTDEAGRGVLQGLEPGQYGLAATPPAGEGFRMATTSLALHGEKMQRVRLRFDEGLSLSGVVVDRAGTPIPDVEVRARFLPKRGAPANLPPSTQSSAQPGVDLQDVDSVRRILYMLGRVRHAVHRVRTGPDGRFTLPHLMPFVHHLSFQKSGYVLSLPLSKEEDGEQPDGLEASPGQDSLRVLLNYLGRVSGRVVRAVDGEPVPSFQIDGQPYTRADGTFTMTAREPGPHTMEILVPGVGGLHVRYETREGEDVNLGDLVVGEGRPVRVRVEDAATALPIADVLLELREAAPGETGQSGGGPLTQVELGLEGMPETGRDGMCLLPDVPTRPLVLTAERKGYEPASVVLGPGEQEVTVRLRAWATVQGWVRVGGMPIAKGDVNFHTLEGRSAGDLEVRNGWFSGHGFPPGRYFVRAECDSCPAPRPVFVSQQLDVPGPQGTLSVDFQEAHGATLEIVTSPEVVELILVQGQPPLPTHRQERRALSRARHPHELLEAEVEGYRFRDVPPGRYTLFFVYRVNDESGPVQREELQIPAEGVLRIQLPPQ